VNNAYNDDMLNGLHEVMALLETRPRLRMTILRGAGKHFQAGADLTWVRHMSQRSAVENERASRATAEAVRRLDGLPIPTLALVHGGCFGGGTGLVAACDIVVASDDAVRRRLRH
jgi:methylglutaconyl-CoA hydratase